MFFSSKLRQIMSFTGVVTDTTSWSSDYCTAAPNRSPSSSSSGAVSRAVARAAPTRAVVPVEPRHLRALWLSVAVATDGRGPAGSVPVGRCDSPAAAVASAAAAAVVNVVDAAATYRPSQVSCLT